MSKAKESDSDKPIPVPEDEDEATLAAIDEGTRDAEAGRTVPASEARRLLQKWITKSASSHLAKERKPAFNFCK